MRHFRALGLVLLASFALGALLASSASATEPGLLCLLAGEPCPAKLTIPLAKVVTTLTTIPGGNIVQCQELSGEATTEGNTEHVVLGGLGLDIKGCKAEKVAACSSENVKGEKDAKEVILLSALDTDIHFVALLEGKVLVPGILVGLLELLENEKKQDLTLNCANVKELVLGALFLKVEGVNLGTSEVTEVKVSPTTLPCDESDKLCTEELNKWGTTTGGKLCPLAIKVGKEEECLSVTASAAISIKIKPMILVDF